MVTNPETLTIITFNENYSLTHKSYLIKLADILTGGLILSQLERTDFRMNKPSVLKLTPGLLHSH